MEQQIQVRNELTATKQEKIEEWEQKKSLQDQKVEEYALNTQLETVTNQLAVVVLNSFNLEFKLDALEEKLPTLLIEDSISLADLLEKQKKSLKAINLLFSNQRPKESLKDISDNLAGKRKDLARLEGTLLTKPAQEKFNALKNELISLEAKKKTLEQKFTTIDAAILATKSAVDQLSELAEIEKEYKEQYSSLDRLIVKNPDKATWVQACHNMEDTLEKHEEFLNKCMQEPHQNVLQGLQYVHTLESKIRSLNYIPSNKIMEDEFEEPSALEEEEIILPKLIVPIKQQMIEVGESYFGKNEIIEASDISGKFAQYFSERAAFHFLKDCFSGLAAIFFGIDYKTPAQERADYLVELSQTMNKFLEKPGSYSFESIIAKIKEGEKKFSPDAETGESYDISLLELLSSLKVKFKAMKMEPHKELSCAEPEKEEEEISTLKPR